MQLIRRVFSTRLGRAWLFLVCSLVGWSSPAGVWSLSLNDRSMSLLKDSPVQESNVAHHGDTKAPREIRDEASIVYASSFLLTEEYDRAMREQDGVIVLVAPERIYGLLR